MNFVDEVPGMDSERLAGMKAQIRFIRAFLYFRLANFYGDIPFFLQDISLEESRRVSRTPYPEVMSALHRELDEIVGDLPTRDELKADDNGRITKAAAMVLKARMYMYENVQRTGNSVSDNMRKGRRYLRQAHPRAGHLRHLQPADPKGPATAFRPMNTSLPRPPNTTAR